MPIDCDKTFSAKSATGEIEFASPDWPTSAPSTGLQSFMQPRYCRYRFRAPKDTVVWLEWKEFHLEEPLFSNKQCLHDYVEIIIVDYQNNQHVSRRYCGTDTPPNLKTMQRNVDIIFHTSSTNHYTGFKGIYRFINEEKMPPPESIKPPYLSNELKQECGGIAQGRYSGEIVSPGYPNAYPGEIVCNWLIRVAVDKQIYVKLDSLQLTDQQACDKAALFIIDGYKHTTLHNYGQTSKSFNRVTDKSQIHFCGDEEYYSDEGSKSYMSERNRMIIQFVANQNTSVDMITKKTNGEIQTLGFKLIWTEVTMSDGEAPEHCSGFLCSGGEYCIDELTPLCASRKRYCIHRSLMCDGVPNCAENDFSDEENCYAIEIMVAGGSVLLLVLLVIFTVVCCARRRNVTQLRRMKNTTLAMPNIDTQDSLIGNSMSNSLPVANSTPNRHNAERAPLRGNDLHLSHIMSSNYHDDEDTQKPFLHNYHTHNTRVTTSQHSREPGAYTSARALPAQIWEESCVCAPHQDIMKTSMGDDLRLTSPQRQPDAQAILGKETMGVYRAQPIVVRDIPPPVAPKPQKKKSVGFKE